MRPEEETIEFLPEESLPPGKPAAGSEVWKILIADDDDEVHESTVFALHDIELCGRPLQLIHAHSAAEAAAAMAEEAEIAVILLDVVMESPDAGLQLVKCIRQELLRRELRIVLRTGQPGHAPELDVIRDFDINDYKTKAELTHTRLITTLIAAIRSYEQLRVIGDNQRGLELIVAGAAQLMQTQTLSSFGREILGQYSSLLRLPDAGMVCARKGGAFASSASEAVRIVAATGSLAGYNGRPLDELYDADIAAVIKECTSRRQHVFAPRHAALYLHDRNDEAVVLIRCERALSAVDRQLAEVFATNASSCFGNVKLVERLNFVAYHDPLTKISNRARFLVEVGSAGAMAQPGQVLCLLDIAHFTDINNALGHAVGDLLLQAIARRLTYACRNVRVARIGADRFGLLGDEALLQPERLLGIMTEPFAAGEHTLHITVNIGYCRITERMDGDVLFKRADMALTRARLSPNTRHVEFTPEMEEQTCWRLDVIRRLRSDFLAGQLAVWYQPQFSLADKSVIGIEALARWPGEAGFVHPPEIFIRLAEDAGLIADIGAWILDQSCATYRRLQDGGCAPNHIAVNVSMPQFRETNFPARVMATLARHELPATILELEITESLLLDEPLIVLHNLETLRQAGALITVDDFGTGYSSLGYLRQLPIDRLKVDRSFVHEIDQGKGDLFVGTIIELAHKLGMYTVAEGVETKAQISRLRELGCDSVQGFLCAEPMSAGALSEWFARRSLH